MRSQGSEADTSGPKVTVQGLCCASKSSMWLAASASSALTTTTASMSTGSGTSGSRARSDTRIRSTPGDSSSWIGTLTTVSSNGSSDGTDTVLPAGYDTPVRATLGLPLLDTKSSTSVSDSAAAPVLTTT